MSFAAMISSSSDGMRDTVPDQIVDCGAPADGPPEDETIPPRRAGALGDGLATGEKHRTLTLLNRSVDGWHKRKAQPGLETEDMTKGENTG
ncbi:MAG: hypothetical protein KAI66_12515 [Lentisphaeria bacterium]|nr:hypothetical protein [Lentisphaeria bacterium]